MKSIYFSALAISAFALLISACQPENVSTQNNVVDSQLTGSARVQAGTVPTRKSASGGGLTATIRSDKDIPTSTVTIINQVLAATGKLIDNTGFKSGVIGEIKSAQIEYSFYAMSADYGNATISGYGGSIYTRPGGDAGTFYNAIMQSYYGRKWKDNATVNAAYEQAKKVSKYSGLIEDFFTTTAVAYSTGDDKTRVSLEKKYPKFANLIRTDLLGLKANGVPR